MITLHGILFPWAREVVQGAMSGGFPAPSLVQRGGVETLKPRLSSFHT